MAEEDRTEGWKPDVDRTPVYRQLWFFVLIAIVLGIAFGLLFEEQALKAQWLADAFIQLIKAVTARSSVTVVIGISSPARSSSASSA